MTVHNLLFDILQIQFFRNINKTQNSQIVVLITNLPVFIPAFLNSPCKTLFGIVTTLLKFSSELLTPDLTGFGKILYALATGSNITLSRPFI